MMHVAVEPNERHKISNVFREASAAGLNVCRTWAFSDGGYQPLQISPGVYDEHVFQVYINCLGTSSCLTCIFVGLDIIYIH